MIKKVEAESTWFLYVTDPLNDDLSAYDVVGENMHRKIKRDPIPGTRMILDPYSILPDNKYSLSYLYWVEPIDLDWLDLQVTRETYSDVDFHFAIKTYYSEGIVCDSCGHEYNGLEVDGSNVYIGNKELLKAKIQLAYKSKADIKCPNCNTQFRILILKLL